MSSLGRFRGGEPLNVPRPFGGRSQSTTRHDANGIGTFHKETRRGVRADNYYRTITMKASTSRKQPEREWAVQLPEGGFEHPFHDPEHDAGPHPGTEPPRTVSESFLSATASFRHRFIRLPNCGCAPSLIRLESNPTGGRR